MSCETNKAQWGLEEVPRIANFKGLIFASFDAAAPSLEEWLGEDGCRWLQHRHSRRSRDSE